MRGRDPGQALIERGRTRDLGRRFKLLDRAEYGPVWKVAWETGSNLVLVHEV